MTLRRLTIEPLTRNAFAPFGQVIEASDAAKHFTINDGNTERYHDLAHIDPGPQGEAIVSIFRGLPRALPFEITMMERHPLGSQAFMPLSSRPYLVAVAAAGEAPTIEQVRVFLCQSQQGVNYAAGVWHHPPIASRGSWQSRTFWLSIAADQEKIAISPHSRPAA
ncbi:ureidoglycolate hydrolase [Advenella kashmirensis WT001]|uniref:Ureidoglycolate hydrolase n=1 Tax=Advenella kashmirensis (strain DSM 17095 / LMG 22695 / WT001) TaxID=1036672 RepID=I3U718_ADVKW|nr:ureidoglycolate hydrolase [Advenella kashmirensis WT001]